MKWRKGASHLRRQVALCYPLKVLLTCHSQTADMLPQQSSIFTTCLSCVFLPWHFLLVHPPTGIRGHGALLSLLWHYTPSALKLLPIQRYSDWMLKCFYECVTASVCERERPVDPQCFLATFGKLSCGTVSQCTGRSVALTGFTRLWFRHSLSRSQILVPFLIYCTVILVNKTRTTLCD